MKILFIITRADSIGGAHVHVRDLSLRLLAIGHQVEVVAGGHGLFTTELARIGVPVRECASLQRSIDPRRDVRALAELRQTIRAARPDLVSTHSSKAGILGRLACAAGGPPCLFTAHGWAFTEGVAQPARWCYRWLGARVGPAGGADHLRLRL